MESPGAFVRGLGRGTTSFATGVATGFISSTATIVGSASSGLSVVASSAAKLTGDDRFMQRRKQLTRASREAEFGLTYGLKAGGKNFANSLTSGLTGLITTPYEQGKKGGTLGFIKGVGMGMLGAAVKPVLGITDGITSVAAGLTHQVADRSARGHRVRFARTFERASQDLSTAVLVPLDLFASAAQHFVERRAFRKDDNDEFIFAVLLDARGSIAAAAAATALVLEGGQASPAPGAGNSRKDLVGRKPFGLVVASKNIFLLSHAMSKMWRVKVAEIAQLELKCQPEHADPFLVRMGLYAKHPGCPNEQVVPCPSEKDARRVFNLLVEHFKLSGLSVATSALAEAGELKDGGGDNIAPSPVSNENGTGDICGDDAQVIRECPADEEVGFEDYVFGTANLSTPPFEHGTNDEIIERSRKDFASIALPQPPDDSQTSITGLSSMIGLLRKAEGAGGKSADPETNSSAGAERVRLDGSETAADLFISTQEYYQLMDDLVWQLVMDWHHNHRLMLNPSRCSAVLIINNSSTFVQILETELQEGAGVVTLGVGKGYDADSRTLLNNGGAAVVFAYGARPSLLDLAHVKIKLFSTAFTAVVTTRESKTKCNRKDNFRATLKEKSEYRYGSKVVILVE